MTTIADALHWYRLRRWDEAAAACAALLARSPEHPDALNLLAEIHLASGDARLAVPWLQRITALMPHDAAAWRRLGSALLSLEQPVDAAAALRAAIALEPQSARAHNNLGQALTQLGDLEGATQSYERAIGCDPNYAIGHSNLAVAWMSRGELVRAESHCRRALTLDPTLAAAHLNLGLVLDRHGRYEEALACHDRAIAQAPEALDAWVARGAVLAKLQRFEAAVESLDHALRLGGDDPITRIHKAATLLAMERGAEALDCADAALRLDPSLVEAHNLRAGALRRLHRHAEALLCIDRALDLDPRFVDGWCNRGIILHEIGATDAATASYRRALELDPRCVRARTRLLSALIPAVPESLEAAIDARRAFDAELRDLRHWFQSAALDATDAITAGRQQFFYLSYREESNKARLMKYRSETARLLARCHPASSGVAAACGESRFKLGFVSAHVFDHSVFNAILRGWLNGLDRSRFELSLFHVGLRHDAVTDAAQTRVDRYEAGARSIGEWARVIRGQRLDALVYPEIGMDEISLCLANLRLADRQCVAWGHPETSGLPTIDDYLSAEAFEPPDAQDHYSERLVTLPHLGVYVERPDTVAESVDLAAPGIRGRGARDRLSALDRRGPLYVCPGVPFKYQPEDDHVFVEIAERLGACTFVFFTHERAELSGRLQARLAAAFRRSQLDPERFLVEIPWQSRAAFIGVLRCADVCLDTIGFSGFNTMLQAVEAGVPAVTYDGRFMRGRLGSGIMRRLGFPELIAASKPDYVEIAVRLGADAASRARLRERMGTDGHRIYADMAAVEALQTTLLSGSIA
jgi:tetratricopeptide (TPR) repeat protein